MFANHETPPLIGGAIHAGVGTERIQRVQRSGSSHRGQPGGVLAGSYTWIPIHYLRKLVIEPPANLRDLIWAQAMWRPARLSLAGVGRGASSGSLSPLIAPCEEVVHLGRESAWEPDDKYGEIPFGAKTMLIDGSKFRCCNSKRDTAEISRCLCVRFAYARYAATELRPRL